ncbi:MFS transporter [Phaeobacter sp. 22II1-1F12B]|uniref:MFS transporter n=1 Tax=Phaeobacter sp. 22II1-1F12B TaxID=1317111 RepID=UPI000B523079|nr:MFS transporter [Phaeobacter sp. 22II1-1F12B]
MRQFIPISALLFGSALLIFAGGINALILPIRGSAEGFSAASLGLLGTGWAVGYVLGCIFCPRLVGKVGHIRSFGVMAAFAAISVLFSLLYMKTWVWVPLRGLSGFCFAGAAMIVESWLSERAEPESRGRIFGIYTMVNLLASTGGQMSLALGDTGGFAFFVFAAIFYCLALVPLSISSSATPKPLVSVRLDPGALWRNSPVAVVAVFCVGISNSAFGTLSAVYADRVGLALGSIALFASLPVLAGAISQVPIGMASDRLDRRKVLVAVAMAALLADLAFILLQPEALTINLLLAAAFGATVFAMYPIIVAHANDHAPPGTGIQVSGGLLMIFGFGSIIGPTVAGFGMAQFGSFGLFLTTLVAHVLLICFTILRIRTRAPVAEAEKGSFVVTPTGRGSTPETAALAYGEGENAPVEPAPVQSGGEPQDQNLSDSAEPETKPAEEPKT